MRAFQAPFRPGALDLFAREITNMTSVELLSHALSAIPAAVHVPTSEGVLLRALGRSLPVKQDGQ